jgi:hypothetical protein
VKELHNLGSRYRGFLSCLLPASDPTPFGERGNALDEATGKSVVTGSVVIYVVVSSRGGNEIRFAITEGAVR